MSSKKKSIKLHRIQVRQTSGVVRVAPTCISVLQRPYSAEIRQLDFFTNQQEAKTWMIDAVRRSFTKIAARLILEYDVDSSSSKAWE